ncbi:hypothetical protein [Longimicrobium sp.]|uniref:hypothetical protein n=1 Tax=Longimicrobium sp. TaxID=2029185 RepID=UPI002B9BAAED|nr:hypothetical protein [Longimicrobium sp.]HSU18004.1 hypothetical protein [Longimicrobium sp.]
MKMRFAAVMLLVLAACSKDLDDGKAAPPPPPAPMADSPVPAPADSVWILDANGVGPVRVGMDVASLAAAVPGGLRETAKLEPECALLFPRTGPRGLSLMLVERRVVRVQARDSSTRVATALGARVGDSEARVRQLYPGARVQPHKYVESGHYLVVIPGAPADTLHRIVFETDGKVVTEMRGGVFPPVEWVEGCS